VLLALAPGPSPEGTLGATVSAACAALGAKVSTCRPIQPSGLCAPDRSDGADDAGLDATVAATVREAGRIDLLAVDGAGLFAHGLAQGGDGHAALRACMDAGWNATRAVVNGAFLPAEPSQPGRRIVYLAPSTGAGDYAEAACAGLENLARTLSIEWARHGIATVTIAPGAQTPAGEVAALTAYLASPAGAYFSGCLLDLRGP
jgi:NAD(P)-dependent dehydrogenase (short-subunit alcohol dehydrogenase family)